MLVELTTLTLLNVTPVGPVTVAPDKKPVPVIVTDSEAPGLIDGGVIDFTVGATRMVKTLPVPRSPPTATPLTTVTARSLPPFALEATFTLAVILVELTTLTLLNVTPVGPVRVAPLRKPVPVTVTGSDAPGLRDEGVIDFTVTGKTTVTTTAADNEDAYELLVGVKTAVMLSAPDGRALVVQVAEASGLIATAVQPVIAVGPFKNSTVPAGLVLSAAEAVAVKLTAAP
jgi:hypothetical protein